MNPVSCATARAGLTKPILTRLGPVRPSHRLICQGGGNLSNAVIGSLQIDDGKNAQRASPIQGCSYSALHRRYVHRNSIIYRSTEQAQRRVVHCYLVPSALPPPCAETVAFDSPRGDYASNATDSDSAPMIGLAVAALAPGCRPAAHRHPLTITAPPGKTGFGALAPSPARKRKTPPVVKASGASLFRLQTCDKL